MTNMKQLFGPANDYSDFRQIIMLLAPNDTAVVTWMVFKLCRVQKSKGGSKEERTPGVKSGVSKSQSSKSDSGYSGSGLNVAIATASAIECVIDEEKPPQNSPKPSSRNEPERSSVESVSSSSGSSEGKGRTEIHVKKSEDLKQREVIKKQMAERKKSAGEKLSNRSSAKQKVVDEENSVRRSAENGEKGPVKEEKRPLPSVSKSRTPRTEVCTSSY